MYQATATYEGQSYVSDVTATDHAAVESVVALLPAGHQPGCVSISVRLGGSLAYSDTLQSYRIATD